MSAAAVANPSKAVAGDLLLMPGRPPFLVVEEQMCGYVVQRLGDDLSTDTRRVMPRAFIAQALESGSAQLYRRVA